MNLDNIDEWIKNGAVAISAGSSLIEPYKTGEYEKITDLAFKYVEKVKKARELYK